VTGLAVRPTAADPLLRVRELSIEFVAKDRPPARVVRDVDLDLVAGSSLGLVGESGCGKTTLAKAVMGILPSTARIASGVVSYDGQAITGAQSQLGRLRWRRISMVFQNAMSTLNPVIKVGSQVAEAVRFHQGVSASVAKARAKELFDWVGIPANRLSAYPHELSGGMKQRVVIALALSCDPDLVIADEPTTALDVVVQEQIIAVLERIRRERQLTLIVVSHDLGVVQRLCDTLAVMYAGRIVEMGPMAQIARQPWHPYTAALLNAHPNLTGPLRRIDPLPGGPPGSGELPSGCAFHPRCPRATEICALSRPPLVAGDDGAARFTECHHPATARPASSGDPDGR
jgi:peptide/nickel transport system ATP-binding protein